MMKYRLTTIILALVAILVVAGYYFWPTPSGDIKPKKRKKTVTAATLAADTASLLGKSTTGIPLGIMTASKPMVADESPYEFHQFSSDTTAFLASGETYKGIGSRDMFRLLIAPPPPPPPPRETVEVRTRNWLIWEIIGKDECIVQDTRALSHNLRVGEVLDGVKLITVEPMQNRVQVALANNPDESKWFSLKPIEELTRGWKLKGSIPALKTAFILTGDGKNNKVKEGDILQHVIVKQVLQNKVVFEYGTMSMEMTP